MQPVGDGVRVDAGYEAGNTVTPFYDPLLAKLIVHGANRQDALAQARVAVDEFKVVGPKNNLPFFAELLDNDKSLFGAITTRVDLPHARLATGRDSVATQTAVGRKVAKGNTVAEVRAK